MSGHDPTPNCPTHRRPMVRWMSTVLGASPYWMCTQCESAAHPTVSRERYDALVESWNRLDAALRERTAERDRARQLLAEIAALGEANPLEYDTQPAFHAAVYVARHG